MSMWGRRPESTVESSSPEPQPSRRPLEPSGAGTASQPARAEPPRQAAEPPAAGSSRIGKSVQFEGEIHSAEDLYVDGIIKGVINIPDHLLVIGPNSKVHAQINARSLDLQGQLQGQVTVAGRIKIQKNGRFDGELSTHRLVIEDGAYFCGTSHMEEPKPQQKAGAAQGTRPGPPKVSGVPPDPKAPAAAGAARSETA